MELFALIIITASHEEPHVDDSVAAVYRCVQHRESFMRKVALVISAGAFILAGAAVAQNASAPKAPAAGAPTAAAAASQSPAGQGAAQVQTSTPAVQQAADAACNADAQKYCSGKEAAERQQCLNENKPSLTAACRASIDGPPRN